MGSIRLSTCRRRRRLIFPAAEGCRDSYQASQKCSQRWPVSVFEPGIVFGTKVETIKFFCRQKWERLKLIQTPLRRVAPGKRTTPYHEDRNDRNLFASHNAIGLRSIPVSKALKAIPGDWAFRYNPSK
jgi:hypothetical protein